MTELLDRLRSSLNDGRKLLVPYVMAGIPDRESFADALAAVEAVADAVEVGLPFSDPLMDGPVIAAAGERAIEDGTGPLDALTLIGEIEGSIPRVAMTYYNPIHHAGEVEFCRRAAKANVAGLIVPDLPLEESETLRAAVAEEGMAWTPLVAPTSPPARVAALTATATGFVYAVSTLGVTGARESLSERAAKVVAACRAETDLPILVGIGVSTPQHAVEATRYADGVVIGTAVVRLLLEEGAVATKSFLTKVRTALDS